ncbi:Clavaminate synthase-like protein [Polyplosphaeria fusca]|uniref:Clavaminate synthase-like protein n=1 Tax=Polyplosphaeria fusca TaxID=682080 RepID=A0A9P4RAM6_9PLEO|nr:Clavaminate synthase-like protein [Polyplosphaeria fusca]
MPLRLGPRPIGVSKRFYAIYRPFKDVQVQHLSRENDALHLDPIRPAVLRGSFDAIPAIKKWFKPSLTHRGYHELETHPLQVHGATIVPLELTRAGSFELLNAPLALLLSHMTSAESSDMRLYLAQCPLDDLPKDLQADLPTPNFISRVGKGDVYGSSLWMGLPPTRTPLHRDPNPNLFVQLAGKKVVRLMTPAAGNHLYDRVRSGLGHAHMRGEEMMVGAEMDRLESAVWDYSEGNGKETQGWEATLDSGDGLYIPLGWWHAVRGMGQGVNCSVNWWFR